MTTKTEDKLASARANAENWYASICDMLTTIDNAGDNMNEREDAEQAIHESALSILVRDGWRTPGQPAEDGAEEFEILLSTGGPALRIWGKLDKHGEPIDAELQMQDWFQPWTTWQPPEHYGHVRENIGRFAAHFYFGE